MNNGAERLRRELMIRFVREFVAGRLEKDIDKMPVTIRPRNQASSRCCIYHDRAVLKYRLMALMGFDCRAETDETRTLKEYYQDATRPERSRPEQPLTVCAAGCDGCPPSRVTVTENCRGCFARPCVYSCPKAAITVIDQQAHIDDTKCIKCGKCLSVCPFEAIIRTKVPCEDACPVNAIRKNEHGVAEIDFERCIFCGKCFNHCPFGAIVECSELLQLLLARREKKKLIALVAPSAAFQFPGGMTSLFTAIAAIGFTDVIEVALGAEMTTENEAREFVDRLKSGATLMTTSCCTAYVEMVKKHVPALLDKVSHTPSPMVYAGRLAREKHPDGIQVFIGPCIAKRHEARHAPEIDMVLTFEELGALLGGLNIDVMAQPPWPFPRPASATARNFAKSCGVTEAVLDELLKEAGGKFKLDSKFINGLDRKSLPILKAYAAGKLPGNFLEVMSCTGGCVSGPTSLVK